MATREDFIQAGLNNTDFLVGPASVLLQDANHFTASGYAAGAFPRGIDDIVNVATGAAMSANGWGYMGHTEGVTPGRDLSTQYLGSDQMARVEEVIDEWGGDVRFTVLETRMSVLRQIWGGDPAGPTTVTGSPTTAQEVLGFGAPLSIPYRRLAILHPDKNGHIWCFVYAKTRLRVTAPPTFGRIARVPWEVTGSILPDDRITDPHHRVMRLYRSTAAVVTVT